MSDITQIALTGTDKIQIKELLPILNEKYGDKFSLTSVDDSSESIKSIANLIDFWANYDAVFYIGKTN